MRVREIAIAVRQRSVERQESPACPPTRESLMEDGSVGAGDFVDPWGTSIVYSCSTEDPDGDVTVRSAGPDRIFNTADDITND